MRSARLLLLIVMVSVVAVFFIFDIDQYLTLSQIKAHQQTLAQYVEQNFAQAALLFLTIYIASTALSLPGAGLLTLLGSAIFGVFWGFILISFASTMGATLAFLSARFLLRDWVNQRFGYKLSALQQGFAKEGAFYLLTLRLIPIFPFFLVNLLMGLTPIKLRTYYWASQLGMLPGTLVYVLTGSELAHLTSTGNIFSPSLIVALSLLGLLPLISKQALDFFALKKRYARFNKPQRFDYNLLVIGAGAGGLVSSYIGAAVNAKVALIEKHKMGGDCLNTGCVPSKALITCARFAASLRQATQLGFSESQSQANFEQVMERVANVIKEIEPHDSIERYQSLGVECIQGEASIVSPWEVAVNGQSLTSRHIVIATGARPWVPNIDGLREVPFLTSDTIWQLRIAPRQLLVLGGGPIGCELSQSFALLGIKVTLVELAPQLLPREEEDVAQLLRAQMAQDGVEILTGWQAIKADFSPTDAPDTLPITLTLKSAQGLRQVQGDQLLLALGRSANVSGFGLEQLDVRLTERGTIAVDPYLRTDYPSLLAVGDVAGPYQFTHVAAHQAWYAAVNALFGQFKRFKVDYRVIPSATYTQPEVARVGLNQKEARAQGITFETARFELAELDRAITDGERSGFIEVLTVPGKDTILGATIVGAHAGERISEFVLAMRHRLGLNKILSTIHAYPTLMEANKYVAGQWKQQHKPHRLLALLRRYHHYRRGK